MLHSILFNNNNNNNSNSERYKPTERAIIHASQLNMYIFISSSTWIHLPPTSLYQWLLLLRSPSIHCGSYSFIIIMIPYLSSNLISTQTSLFNVVNPQLLYLHFSMLWVCSLRSPSCPTILPSFSLYCLSVSVCVWYIISLSCLGYLLIKPILGTAKRRLKCLWCCFWIWTGANDVVTICVCLLCYDVLDK